MKKLYLILAALVLAGCAHTDGLNQVDIRHRLDQIARWHDAAMAGIDALPPANIEQLKKIDAAFSDVWSLAVVLLNEGNRQGAAEKLNDLAGLLIRASLFAEALPIPSVKFRIAGNEALKLRGEIKK